jgi:hypothetical protein
MVYAILRVKTYYVFYYCELSVLKTKLSMHIPLYLLSQRTIQSDSGVKVIIFGGDNIGSGSCARIRERVGRTMRARFKQLFSQ